MLGTKYVVYNSRRTGSGMYYYYIKGNIHPELETDFMAAKKWRYHFTVNQILDLKTKLHTHHVSTQHIMYVPLAQLKAHVHQETSTKKANHEDSKSKVV